MSKLYEEIARQEREQIEIEEKVKNDYDVPTPEEQEMIADVIRQVSDQYAEELFREGSDPDAISDKIRASIEKICLSLLADYETQKKVEKAACMTALGNGPIEKFIEDETVTEIVVQKYDNIVIERQGKIEKVPDTFYSENQLQTIIQRIVQKVNRQINITEPIVDARLKDGSRVNATIPPVSPDGATLTIRKHNQSMLSGKDYVDIGSMSKEMLMFLAKCVIGKICIFVSGGTGSGKTTFLNMLSEYIPKEELIITIEDTLELKLQQPNVRRMEVRESNGKEMMNVNQKALVKAALRQRPDRIILGESRDGSIVDLISAMSTGHEGSMSTIHANSPRNLFDVRIPILYSMNTDTNFSEDSIAMQMAEAVQLVAQISRMPDGSRKITQITEVNGIMDNKRVALHDIYVYNRATDCFEATGYVPERIINKLHDLDINLNEELFVKK